jgi:hypothetical protein
LAHSGVAALQQFDNGWILAERVIGCQHQRPAERTPPPEVAKLRRLGGGHRIPGSMQDARSGKILHRLGMTTRRFETHMIGFMESLYWLTHTHARFNRIRTDGLKRAL